MDQNDQNPIDPRRQRDMDLTEEQLEEIRQKREQENDALAEAQPTAKDVVLRIIDGAALGGTKLVSLLSGLLAAFLIVYSGFVLYDTFYTQENAGNAWELLEYRPEIIEDEPVPTDGVEELSRILPDFRAWLTVYDTTIDYPLMQGEDDLYYSSHDLYGNPSLTGAIYLAAANSEDLSDNYNLIYGHHMDNRIMFGALDSYENDEFFESHRDAIVITKTQAYDVKIFAVIMTDAYESIVYTVGNRDLQEIYDYIELGLTNAEDKNVVTYQYDPSVLDGATKILALSTCADATTSGRLVVFGVMTEHETVGPMPGPADTDEVTDDNPIDDPEITNDPDAPVTPDNPGGEDNPNDNPNPDTAETNPQDNPADNIDNPSDNIDQNPDDQTDTNIDGNPDDTIPDQPVVDIPDEPTPLDRLLIRFKPTGDRFGGHCWALVNLLATIVTVYLFLPLLHLKAKYMRRRMMRQVNDMKIELRTLEQLREDQRREKDRIDQRAYEDRMSRAEKNKLDHKLPPIDMEADITEQEFDNAVEELYYRLKRFTRRSRTGYTAELIAAVGAVVLFILTEDIRLPMVLIDKWTVFHLVIMAICWIVDVRLARYRSKAIEEEREELEEDIGKTREKINV